MRQQLIALLSLCVISSYSTAAECKPADCQQIKLAVLDYAEGWYSGDSKRMGNALADDLVKRHLEQGRLDTMGKAKLVELTAAGYGKTSDTTKQRKDISVLDVENNIALVRLRMFDWVDYMQLGKIDGRWRIVNVLWGAYQP
jgi:hypothetical protein